jgi:hypothetical protein
MFQQQAVKTYVGVFNVHYMCILCGELVGFYEDCDKMHSVYNVSLKKCVVHLKFINITEMN